MILQGSPISVPSFIISPQSEIFFDLAAGLMQARRQEMKCGGVFCKKVENGGCFVKSGTFLNAGCLMYSIIIGIFLFYILLIWGCVRTQRTPCLRACDVACRVVCVCWVHG